MKGFPKLGVALLALLLLALSACGDNRRASFQWPTVEAYLFEVEAGRLALSLTNVSGEAVQVKNLVVTNSESGEVIYQISLVLAPGFHFSSSFAADTGAEHTVTYELEKEGRRKQYAFSYNPSLGGD